METAVAQILQCLSTNWKTGVRSPAEAKDYSSSLCVQNSSEAHPASYPMGTRGRSPKGKALLGVTLNGCNMLFCRYKSRRVAVSKHRTAINARVMYNNFYQCLPFHDSV
jgi:hypothetical protein